MALALAASTYHSIVAKNIPPPPLVLVTDHKAEAAVQAVPQVIYRGLPVRLKIPAIKVDVPVESLGSTAEGVMLAPISPMVVGWYKYGAIPGETGNAVMAGHVVGPRGEPGVFYDLRKLQTGDILQVVDAKGQVASFAVRVVRRYDESQQHTEIFNSSEGTHLNLITCAGDWNAARHEYLQRLVVFADQVF